MTRSPAAFDAITRRVKALELRPWSTAFELVESVAEVRNRRIVLAPMDLTGTGVTGSVVAFAGHDAIVYDDRAPAFFAEHVLFHEVSHLLCGHLDAAPIDPQVGVRILDRGLDVQSPLEVEAELMATALALHRWRPSVDTSPPPVMHPLLSTLAPHVSE